MENNDFLIRESGTHYTIRLPVEGKEIGVMIDKQDFTVTIPAFEYMQVPSIVKIIAHLSKNDNKNNPVVTNFLKFLQEPVNKEELEIFLDFFRRSQ